LAALTTFPAKLCGVAHRLGTIEKGKLAHLTIVDGNYFDDGKVREVWVDGRIYQLDVAPAKSDEAKKKEEKKQNEAKELQARVARSPLEGRGAITNPPVLIIQNATIWTSSKAGILTNGTLLVENGKIQGVGRGLLVEPSTRPVLEIDGSGLHITPGLIDCHSHSMILGAVNESTLPSTAMVRIGDVVNSETGNIYEQLAGGLTVANLLHGSANPIGGQNQVIRLRDGASPEGLKFTNAPPGIKFALGENVKQSNWGEKHTTRFPQTRMGVKTFINNRFVAGQQYIREWEQFRSKGGTPPRRDLELETIAEILQGKRWIHCHSYRQDEILMMLRLMQEFGVTIGTFQHISEGYKVADELAQGGVGASAFADWWGYKFEVFDGIPQNGAIMHERGVLVSFNSDSSDLARRLNTEAAKAVKHGGVSEEEALKFVTINPAKQLRIDRYVGSLERGKDADFVIWSGNPLDTSTICLQTWIQGAKYFDRSLADERAAALETERKALVEKARKVLKVVSASGAQPDPAGKEKFFHHAFEHMHAGEVRHCDD
ncbi:MAG: amidohydrolase family protein, partial [Limisphaerales bacterium]